MKSFEVTINVTVEDNDISIYYIKDSIEKSLGFNIPFMNIKELVIEETETDHDKP